jgi:hypothetical protein
MNFMCFFEPYFFCLFVAFVLIDKSIIAVTSFWIGSSSGSIDIGILGECYFRIHSGRGPAGRSSNQLILVGPSLIHVMEKNDTKTIENKTPGNPAISNQMEILCWNGSSLLCFCDQAPPFESSRQPIYLLPSLPVGSSGVQSLPLNTYTPLQYTYQKAKKHKKTTF